MLTMRPFLRAAMPGSTAWCMCSAPVRLIAISLSHCAGSVLVKGLKTSQPALLTSTSIGPSFVSAAATAASTLARSVMSQWKACGDAAFGADRGGDLLGRLEVQVEHGDTGAFAAEAAAGGAADAAAAAGDDDGLVVESLVIVSPPLQGLAELIEDASHLSL